MPHRVIRQSLEDFCGQFPLLFEDDIAAFRIHQIASHHLTEQELPNLLRLLFVDDPQLFMVITLQFHLVIGFNALRALILIEPLARKDFHIDDNAFHTRRHRERRILHITGLLTKDRPEQFLFRSQLSLAFRRHLTDKDIARLDLGTDADDAALIQISQRLFADIGNISRHIFLTQLGVTSFHLEFFNMDGREGVLAHQLFTEQDGIFEVIPTPGHERDKHVFSQRQLSMINRRPIPQDLPLLHRLTDSNHGSLRNAGILI